MSDGSDELRPDAIPEVPAHAPAHVDRRLLSLLVCPVTRGPLVYDAERQELISKGAGRAFPIHDGIPVMLIDEARLLED
jgi:uncharacterized protein YbaR (Trm112 family)